MQISTEGVWHSAFAMEGVRHRRHLIACCIAGGSCHAAAAPLLVARVMRGARACARAASPALGCAPSGWTMRAFQGPFRVRVGVEGSPHASGWAW